MLSARFRLTPKPKDEIKSYMAELRAKRVEKQPLEYPSAGSTFKRPEGYFAGSLSWMQVFEVTAWEMHRCLRSTAAL